ncbi:MAG TPA: translation initiation factor IF-2, partial [Lachnospiraceae bacterium]|nr:translation initiation factor IF-2 [Lachnospiraceae bacterium]
MAKIRVYELAKEIGVESKQIVELLAKDNIEVKSQSGLSEELCDKVKSKFAKASSDIKEKAVKVKEEAKKEVKE